MTTLLEAVAELRELEEKATPAPWRIVGGERYLQLLSSSSEFYINFEDSDRDDPEIIVKLRNAAPTLLDVLEGFREGDAEKINAVIEMIDFALPSELLGVEDGDEVLDFALDEHKELIRMKETLYRMADAARKMEGKNEARQELAIQKPPSRLTPEEKEALETICGLLDCDHCPECGISMFGGDPAPLQAVLRRLIGEE